MPLPAATPITNLVLPPVFDSIRLERLTIDATDPAKSVTTIAPVHKCHYDETGKCTDAIDFAAVLPAGAKAAGIVRIIDLYALAGFEAAAGDTSLGDAMTTILTKVKHYAENGIPAIPIKDANGTVVKTLPAVAPVL